MALDREILKIEEMYNDFNVNKYTIGYDSNTKRFFKGFAPKAVGGGAIATTVFAGLAVASLPAVGLLGLGAGAIASISVAAGVMGATAYTAGKYGVNFSKARFKNMGIGGEKGEEGTIEFIQSIEDEIVALNLMLKEQPNTKTFNVDGIEMSRRAVQKYIKEREQIAYYGLKYLLGQGTLVTDKINFLNIKREKYGLTENEEYQLDRYLDIMTRIANCSKYMASQRSEFNPYKGLIINNIYKGCLLGLTDNQNNQIKLLSKTKDSKESAKEIYTNMYEAPLLKESVKQRKATYEAESDMYNESKEMIEIINTLIKYDADINKLNWRNRKVAQQIIERNSYEVLIKIASNLSNSLPNSREWKTYKNVLASRREEFKKAIESENKDQINEKKIALDDIVSHLYNYATSVNYNKGKKAGAEEIQTLFDDYKKVTRRQINRAKADIKTLEEDNNRLVKDNDGLKAKNKGLEEELDNTSANFERAMDGWMAADSTVKKRTAQNKKLKAENASHGKYIKQNNEEKAKLASAYGSATRTIKGLQQDLNTANYELEEKSAESSASKTELKKSKSLIKKLANEITGLDAKIEEMDANNDEQVKILTATTRENMKLHTDVDRLQETIASKDRELNNALNKNNRLMGSNVILGYKANRNGKEVEKRDNIIADMGHEAHKTSKKLEKVTEERDELKKGTETLLGDNQRLSRELDKAEGQLDIVGRQMESQKEEFTSIIGKKDEEIARKEVENKTVRGKFEKERDKNGVLSIELEGAKKDLETQRRTIKSQDKTIQQQAEENKQQAQIIVDMGYDLHKAKTELNYERDLRGNLEKSVLELYSLLKQEEAKFRDAEDRAEWEAYKSARGGKTVAKKLSTKSIAKAGSAEEDGRLEALKDFCNAYKIINTYLDFVENNDEYGDYSGYIQYGRMTLDFMKNGGVLNSDVECIKDTLNVLNEWFNDNGIEKGNLPKYSIEDLRDFYQGKGYIVTR